MQYEEERATKTLPDRTPVIDMTDTKKPRTPRSYDDIARGASKLSLEDKAKLRDQLIEEIAAEADKLKEAAENAAKLLK